MHVDWAGWAIFGLIATAVLTIVMTGAQFAGWTRHGAFDHISHSHSAELWLSEHRRALATAGLSFGWRRSKVRRSSHEQRVAPWRRSLASYEASASVQLLRGDTMFGMEGRVPRDRVVGTAT